MMRNLILALALVAWLAGLVGRAQAQTDQQPLIDMVPFDVIVLTATAGGQSVKIAPLPQRNYDKRPPDTERLEVVLLSHPERKYEILWRDIEQLNLFERMIYDESHEEAGREGLYRGLHEPELLDAKLSEDFESGETAARLFVPKRSGHVR